MMKTTETIDDFHHDQIAVDEVKNLVVTRGYVESHIDAVSWQWWKLEQ